MEYRQGLRKELWEKEGIKPQLLPNVEVRGNYKIDLSVWLKWLDYEPEFEIELIETLSSKNPSTLSLKELQILSKYQERKRISLLIEKYETDFDLGEYEVANTYLQTKSIEELMLDKLSKEEIEYAKLEIKRLSQLPYEELDKKVEEMISEHSSSNLSMVDSYILHKISEVDMRRSISRFNAATGRMIENDKVRSIQYYSAKY